MKKSSNLFSLFAASACVIAAATSGSLAWGAVMPGEGGSTTHGGGELSRGELRDLVEKGNCIVENGLELAEENAPAIKGLLRTLDQVNWVFGMLLREEIRALRVCRIDMRLKGETTDDSGGLYSEDGGQLIAIREGRVVYVDDMLYQRLLPLSRAAFFVHEAMHGFVFDGPENPDRHNMRVRHMVNAIVQNAFKPMRPDQFQLQMDFASVCVPSLEVYDPFKPFFTAVVSDAPASASLVGAAADIVSLNDAGFYGATTNAFLSLTPPECVTSYGGAAIAQRIERLFGLTGLKRDPKPFECKAPWVRDTRAYRDVISGRFRQVERCVRPEWRH